MHHLTTRVLFAAAYRSIPQHAAAYRSMPRHIAACRSTLDIALGLFGEEISDQHINLIPVPLYAAACFNRWCLFGTKS